MWSISWTNFKGISYGEVGQWSKSGVHMGLRLWNAIHGGWDSFSKFIQSRVRFWTNIWCGVYSLKELYPNLFALAVDKETSVASYLEHPSEGEVQHWNPQFIRPLKILELELVDSFFRCSMLICPPR